MSVTVGQASTGRQTPIDAPHLGSLSRTLDAEAGGAEIFRRRGQRGLTAELQSSWGVLSLVDYEGRGAPGMAAVRRARVAALSGRSTEADNSGGGRVWVAGRAEDAYKVFLPHGAI